jgi:hypothetical protein
MRCTTLIRSNGVMDDPETTEPRVAAQRDQAMLPARLRPTDTNAGGMSCVSPPCPGIVRDDRCPVCGLRQRRTVQGVTVDGPLNVKRRLRRISGRCEIPVIGESATVGNGVVTVYLRLSGEVTRTFALPALVSIEAV